MNNSKDNFMKQLINVDISSKLTLPSAIKSALRWRIYIRGQLKGGTLAHKFQTRSELLGFSFTTPQNDRMNLISALVPSSPLHHSLFVSSSLYHRLFVSFSLFVSSSFFIVVSLYLRLFVLSSPRISVSYCITLF